MHKNMRFVVTVCPGYGDGGDAAVEVDVTDEEYGLLKRCSRAGEDMDGFEGLEELCSRLKSEAVDDSCFCADEDTDPEDVSCIFQMPNEVLDAVEAEDYPEGDQAILDRAAALMEEDDPDELLETFLDENEDRYSGTLHEDVFLEAVRRGMTEFVELLIDYVNLSDPDEAAVYLEEAADEEIEELLMSHGACYPWDHYSDCLFAMETVNGSVLACDDDLLGELREKYLAYHGLTEADILRMLQEEEAPEDFDGDPEADAAALGWSVRNGALKDGSPCGEEVGWTLKELLEGFGWQCDFEGDSWKLETNGVYFIDTPMEESFSRQNRLEN